MDPRRTGKRKRSRFASTEDVNTRPQTSPKIVGQASSNPQPLISIPTVTRGKYKSAIRRALPYSSSSSKATQAPPDAQATFFSYDGDDSDYDSNAALLSTHFMTSPSVIPDEQSLPVSSTPSEPVQDSSLPDVRVLRNSDVSKTTEVDPLDLFMQSLNKSGRSTNQSRVSVIPSQIDRPDSPSLSDENTSSTRGETRPKRIYEKVDHSKIDYPPFEKNLYIEVPELTSMTNAQVFELRRSLDNIRVRGRDCPRPITAWPQCGLSSAILNILQRHGYSSPTPIQAQAIPCVMSGRDVIGIARTGSGKTLAFLLPLLRHIARRPRAALGDGPSALVIAPTRELAIQIYGETKHFAKALFIHCVCAYGGSGLKDQIAELKRGADVVICTPGRMIDLLAMNSGRICNLRRVTFVVLDEADRMFDLGFEPQLTRIVENIRPDRQTVMFSATFPVQVEKLARKILKYPIEIMVGGNSVAAASIDQHVEVRTEDSKFFRLLELLGLWYEKGSTLIFVDRQDNADRIFRDLSKARYKCLPLHGGMDQADRDSTIVDFKNGDVKVLVATSVAARGLDVKNLTLVVNFDVPSHYEDYIHRVGRTGRAGRSGTAYTFITSDQESHAPDLVRALEKSARAAALQDASGLDKEVAKRIVDEAAAEAVPQELRHLADNFEMKRKAGVVKYAGGSGYGGRGFKFEENDEYHATKTAIRKMQAKQYGIDDDVVEDDESDGGEDSKNAGEEDKDKARDSDDDIVEVKPSTKSAKANGSEDPKSRISSNMAISTEPLTNEQVKMLLAEAASSAEKIADEQNVDEHRKRDLIAKAKAEVLSMAAMRNGKKPNSVMDPADNDKDLELREDMPGEEQNGSRYAAELEINDFPPNARWQVVRKGALSDVEEFTGCVVTTRGNFYPPGRNPPAGERKLHFLIEGPSRSAVKTAKRDIQQKLEEAAALSRPGDNQYTKYSVV